MRVNGLFGWVEYNNTRSLALLFSFILLMQPLAAITLFVPLLYADPAHAPWHHWIGYAVRYVPAVTLAAAAVFALQMWWHLKIVRKDMAFRFVDNDDEPRLCALVEPLSIAAGIPTPSVGVIDSPVMNAFACGVTQKASVVVFTRGIIDNLDDDELSAVIAHELVHIRNGDTRLIAAANVFVRINTLIDRSSGWKPQQYRKVAPLLLVPGLFLVYLGIALLSQLCLRLGFASRLLISSAREFIADAEAVRLTQHPAALLSALQLIQGNSDLPGLPFEQDAMMIDGMTKRWLATHPPITDRIQAIVATTGQVALEARPRRDTRAMSGLLPGGFGRDGWVEQNRDTLEWFAATGTAPRASVLRASVLRTLRQADNDRLILGLRWDIALAMLATFLVAMVAYHGNIEGGVGQIGRVLYRPGYLDALRKNFQACGTAQWQHGRDVQADGCDSIWPTSHSGAENQGGNGTQTARLRSDFDMATVSLGSPGSQSTRQALSHGGFMVMRRTDKLPIDSPATDLMPSYALPVHEAWLRLTLGNIAPFMRALQCGILVHAHVSAVTDQSVTWSITTEAIEQIRLTATLTAGGPGVTRVTLAIMDFEKTVSMHDSRTPHAPPSTVMLRPALSPPVRPFFAEAINTILEGRSFQTSRVNSPPSSDPGAKITADICASQRGRLGQGSRFSINDRPMLP
jgi:Zn-dependent protease with chaperone function